MEGVVLTGTTSVNTGRKSLSKIETIPDLLPTMQPELSISQGSQDALQQRNELRNSILERFEYLFSERNLKFDIRLAHLRYMGGDDQWAVIDAILDFPTMKQWRGLDLGLIIEALRESVYLLEVSEDGEMVRLSGKQPPADVLTENRFQENKVSQNEQSSKSKEASQFTNIKRGASTTTVRPTNYEPLESGGQDDCKNLNPIFIKFNGAGAETRHFSVRSRIVKLIQPLGGTIKWIFFPYLEKQQGVIEIHSENSAAIIKMLQENKTIDFEGVMPIFANLKGEELNNYFEARSNQAKKLAIQRPVASSSENFSNKKLTFESYYQPQNLVVPISTTKTISKSQPMVQADDRNNAITGRVTHKETESSTSIDSPTKRSCEDEANSPAKKIRTEASHYPPTLIIKGEAIPR
ncbi:hypothetical protein G9A89_018109 [Geosiphon pyriformis]|nr:hypothetical protein G9A89_018109 [Geosiphon pyriformis]